MLLWSNDLSPAVAFAAVRSTVVVLLLLVHCLLLPILFAFFCVWSLFCYAVLSVFSSFAIIFLRKRELVDLLKLIVFLMSCDC